MSRVRPPTESQILRAVDDQPRGHKEVHARVDMWSQRTVKDVLNDLARRGVIDKTIEPVGRFGFAKYRLRKTP